MADSLFKKLNENIEKSNLNFVQKVKKENEINLLYHDYNIEESEKISNIINPYSEKVGFLHAMISGYNARKLKKIYGFKIEDIKKSDRELFKSNGLIIISIKEKTN